MVLLLLKIGLMASHEPIESKTVCQINEVQTATSFPMDALDPSGSEYYFQSSGHLFEEWDRAMNKSEVLRALEWVDQIARDGDADLLAKARLALEEELHSQRNTTSPEKAYKVALESFVRKHGREPLEDVIEEE
jgi:hypothetical protein